MERKGSKEVQVTKAAFKGLHLLVCFLHNGELAPVLKHNQVSEVFKGFKVHDFEYYGQRSYVLKWLLALKIIRKRAEICDRCSLEYFAVLCSADFTRVDGPTMLEL